MNEQIDQTQLKELTPEELDMIHGGSDLSLQVFRMAGMAFGYFELAAMNGAPHGNIYRHSG